MLSIFNQHNEQNNVVVVFIAAPEPAFAFLSRP